MTDMPDNLDVSEVNEPAQAPPPREPTPWLNVVLFEPEIAANTGAIGRTCVAAGARLWLVRPLGFHLDDRHLRRAGLDYWEHLDLRVSDELAQVAKTLGRDRLWSFSTRASRVYTEADFQPGDALVFGPESRGLPRPWLDECPDRAAPDPDSSRGTQLEPGKRRGSGSVRVRSPARAEVALRTGTRDRIGTEIASERDFEERVGSGARFRSEHNPWQSRGKEAVRQMGRILGLDFGLRRVGGAISDPARVIASPLEVYERKNDEQDARHYRALIREHEVERIVVGLPVHTSGREGQLAGLARQWGTWLASTTGLPVTYTDERYTSIEADNLMIQSGLKRQKRKALRDKLAAQILLQGFLDAGCPKVEPASKPLADAEDHDR